MGYRAGVVSLLAAGLVGCGGVEAGGADPAVGAGRIESSVQTPVMIYRGGPLVGQVKVKSVFWTGGVDPSVKLAIDGFYQSMVTGPYMSWMAEYGTGPGSNLGSFTINVPLNPNLTLVKDAVTDDVGAELDAHIRAGELPAPDGNTVYAVYLPPGYTARLGSGTSCQSFCAYHHWYLSPKLGKTIIYAVMPDQGCAFCMQGQANVLRATTIVSSHELAEAVTDPIPNNIGSSSPGTLGWTSTTGAEVSDVCQRVSVLNHRDYVSEIADVGGFRVQKSWSNAQNNCTAVPNLHGIVGAVDGVSADGVVSGWACDPDSPGAQVAVTVLGANAAYPPQVLGSWLSGGTTLAQGSTIFPSEPAVNNACGGGTVHRFNITLPASTQGQPLYVGAVDLDSGSTYHVGTVQLPAANLELLVPNGGTWYVSNPTPPNVGRDEEILIRNTGAGRLNLLNINAVLSGPCFQMVLPPPAYIPPGGSDRFRVRLLCGSLGTWVAHATLNSNSAVNNSYGIDLRGVVAPGMVYDLRLASSFVPTQGAPRTVVESAVAQPASANSFFYDMNQGAFENRPGGACTTLNNPTYYKVSMRGNVSITSCRVQASWDSEEIDCPANAVDELNLGREIIINTDDINWELPRCGPPPFIPPTPHLPMGSLGFLRVRLNVGGVDYVRRVDFIRHP